MTVAVRTDTTPSLHPAAIQAIEGYDDQTMSFVAEAEEAFTIAYQGVGAVHAARKGAKSNPTLNEAAQTLVVADFAGKHTSRIFAKFDNAVANLKRSIASTELTLSAPVEGAANGGFTSEIRAHAKSLKRTDRSGLLMSAIENMDMKTIAAVLGAPPYLSGLSEPEANLYIRKFYEMKHPDLTKRLSVMKAALALLYDRGRLVFGEMDTAIGASSEKVAELRAARANAEKAYAFGG